MNQSRLVESLAKLHAAEGEGALLDVLSDPVFQRNVVDAFVTPATFDSPTGGRWTIERISKAPIALPSDVKITVGKIGPGDGTLVLGEVARLELFAKSDVADPELEMMRFLTVDAAFPHAPALLGTITYRDNSGDSVVGILQEYIPRSRTTWDFILGSARSGAAVATHDLERLGQTTRELHHALAGDAAAQVKDFAPVRAGAGDVERWAQRTKEMIRQAMTLLERQRGAGKLPPERAAEAEALVRRRDHYLTWIEEVADLIGDDGGAKIRVHGDYKLDHVLRTTSDSFVIVHFEGDPSRPLAERREKTSALRDVAGMLRSLGYAAATLVQSGKDPAKKGSRTPAELELLSGRWERDARAAFLRGYTGAMNNEDHLWPRDPQHFDALLGLFEAERAFSELAYELNHRPGWEWIPMRGISKLLVK